MTAVELPALHLDSKGNETDAIMNLGAESFSSMLAYALDDPTKPAGAADDSGTVAARSMPPEHVPARKQGSEVLNVFAMIVVAPVPAPVVAPLPVPSDTSISSSVAVLGEKGISQQGWSAASLTKPEDLKNSVATVQPNAEVTGMMSVFAPVPQMSVPVTRLPGESANSRDVQPEMPAGPALDDKSVPDAPGESKSPDVAGNFRPTAGLISEQIRFDKRPDYTATTSSEKESPVTARMKIPQSASGPVMDPHARAESVDRSAAAKSLKGTHLHGQATSQDSANVSASSRLMDAATETVAGKASHSVKSVSQLSLSATTLPSATGKSVNNNSDLQPFVVRSISASAPKRGVADVGGQVRGANDKTSAGADRLLAEVDESGEVANRRSENEEPVPVPTLSAHSGVSVGTQEMDQGMAPADALPSASAAGAAGSRGPRSADLPDSSLRHIGPAATGQIHAARLFQTGGHAEMRVGLKTEIFGAVHVRTVVSDKHIELALASERGDLKGSIAPDLPGLQGELRQHDLRLEQVRVLEQAAEDRGHFSGGRQQQFQNRHSGAGASAGFEVAEPEDERVERHCRGLSIRI